MEATEKICLYLPGSMVRRLRRQGKTGGYNGSSDYIAAVLSDAWNIRRPVLRGPGRPNRIGESCVILNGEEIMRVTFSDADGGSVTTGDGLKFATSDEFADYLVSLIAPKRS